MRIFWEEEDAEEDLGGIFDHILADNPEAALRVVDTIRQTVQMLIEYPYLGRSGRVADTRELVIPGTPSGHGRSHYSFACSPWRPAMAETKSFEDQ